MTPYEATLAGLDAGAASVRIELDNGTIKAYRTDDGSPLLDVSDVKAGTWDALWTLLEGCGKVEYRAGRPAGAIEDADDNEDGE